VGRLVVLSLCHSVFGLGRDLVVRILSGTAGSIKSKVSISPLSSLVLCQSHWPQCHSRLGAITVASLDLELCK